MCVCVCGGGGGGGWESVVGSLILETKKISFLKKRKTFSYCSDIFIAYLGF